MATAGTATVLQQFQVSGLLEETISNVLTFLPRLVGAVVVLLIGWVVGIALGKLVTRLTDSAELDKLVQDTPLGRIMGGSERAISTTFGKIAKWFVYAIALLAAADVLAIELLSEWMSTAVSYLPAFVAGLLVIVLGFVVADFIGDAITRTRTATQTPYTSWFATGTRMFLYFTAIVIGLDTMGVDVSILLVFAQALAWGIAAALALGFGIALGLGGREYVADNIDNWAGKASAATPPPSGSQGTSRSSGAGPGGAGGSETSGTDGSGVHSDPDSGVD
jgi:small-conductance mechanosensitive channel